MSTQVHKPSLFEAVHNIISNAALLCGRSICTERRKVDYWNAEGRVGTYILSVGMRFVWKSVADCDRPLQGYYIFASAKTGQASL